MRYTEDTKNLMQQLRKVVKRKNDSGKEDSDVLYHELIKKMPGIALIFACHNITSQADVAEEALHRSGVNRGKVDYRNTKILLLNKTDKSEEANNR